VLRVNGFVLTGLPSLAVALDLGDRLLLSALLSYNITVVKPELIIFDQYQFWPAVTR
jgi:hypothetical protein